MNRRSIVRVTWQGRATIQAKDLFANKQELLSGIKEHRRLIKESKEKNKDAEKPETVNSNSK